MCAMTVRETDPLLWASSYGSSSSSGAGYDVEILTDRINEENSEAIKQRKEREGCCCATAFKTGVTALARAGTWIYESLYPQDSNQESTDPQVVRSVAFGIPRFSQALAHAPDLENDNPFQEKTSDSLEGLLSDAGYENDRSLGQGSFGSVDLYTNQNGEGFAVKVLDEEITLSSDPKESQWFQANVGQNGMVPRGEAVVMGLPGHPNVLKTYGLVLYNKDTKMYRVVTDPKELKPGAEGHEVVAATLTQAITGAKELSDVIPAKGMPLNTVKKIAFQVASALAHLHSQGVIHCDIKPENILYDPKTEMVYLIDFGFAINLHAVEDGDVTTACGSPRYVAPEILEEKKYDAKVDAWSFGVTLFVMKYGYHPFGADPKMPLNEVRDEILGFEFHTLFFQTLSGYLNQAKGFQIDQLSCDEQAFLDLIDRLILTQELEFIQDGETIQGGRITVEQALQHPFFTQQ